MRISDWSSDVCSSDLALALSEDLPPASRERLQGLVAHIRELDELVLELLSYSRLQNPEHLPERVEVALDEFIDSILGSVDEDLAAPDVVIDVLLHGKIGRASCRESGCQYG